MTCDNFTAGPETTVPAVTAAEMREIDRVAVEEVGLELLQMMENAGRNLAAHARQLRHHGPVVVLAGGGGNGGGGLCAARHLANRNVTVRVVLDREPEDLSGATAAQFGVLREMGVGATDPAESVADAGLVVDAIIGYSLRGVPRGRVRELIERANETSAPVLSLDVPSGYDATTGETPGVAVSPTRTLTLALPKTGLNAPPGDLFLGDIGIPATVFERVGIEYGSLFRENYWVELTR